MCPPRERSLELTSIAPDTELLQELDAETAEDTSVWTEVEPSDESVGPLRKIRQQPGRLV